MPGNGAADGTCAVPCDLIISAEYGKWGGDIDKTQPTEPFSNVFSTHIRSLLYARTLRITPLP